MRAFRRTGPSIVLQETPARARRIAGPHDGEPGDLVEYDDTNPDEAKWADALAADPYFVEVVEQRPAYATPTIAEPAPPAPEPAPEPPDTPDEPF